jgi:UDP-N-acetylmuramate dehydrogenase
VEIQQNIPLAQYTTLKVGGPARFFVEAGSASDILQAYRFARDQKIDFFVMGGGSNLLVSDDGFAGLVARIAGGNVRCELDGEARLRLMCDAGVEWDSVVRVAVERNAAGVECLAGIPGSVGGTPVQNVGAYGQEVASTIARVHAVDLGAERVVELAPEECGFAYRRSLFNTSQRGRYAITRVDYKLCLDQPPSLHYRDVKQYFAERGIAQPGVKETAEAVRLIRARKGMLLDPDDPDCRSAGSFFKNPIVTGEVVASLARAANCPMDKVPQFAADVDNRNLVKISAAWLIELAGFHKGFAQGRAALSTKHVLAIVNSGGAFASEIAALRDLIITEVFERTGIRLEQEPVSLGFSRLAAA